MDFLNTPNFRIMQKSLDVLWQKMNVTSHNISNIDTPHYKAKKLEFETILRQKLNAVNNSHALAMRYKRIFSPGGGKIRELLDSVNPQIVIDKTTETRTDGNNVDIDYENLELTRNKLQYDFMVRKISDEFSLLRHAISEGR